MDDDRTLVCSIFLPMHPLNPLYQMIILHVVGGKTELASSCTDRITSYMYMYVKKWWNINNIYPGE